MNVTTRDGWETVLQLKSGRELTPNCGIIGITENWHDGNLDKELRVFDGYDGSLNEDIDNPFTKEEREELAEYAIGLWRRYAAAAAAVQTQKL